MKFHWVVLMCMAAGVAVGLGLQGLFEAPAWAGARWGEAQGGGIALESSLPGGPAEDAGLAPGDVVVAAVLHRGRESGKKREERVELRRPSDFAAVLERSEHGEVVWLVAPDGSETMLTLDMDPGSGRARWIEPFDFVADVFMALLKLLIVPIVLTSIVSGVSGVGDVRDLGRLGGKTFLYYIATSLLAIVVGQVLVSVVRPGEGAELGLARLEPGDAPEERFSEVIRRMVPDNVFGALSDNGAMLQVIFFALLFGFFLTRTAEPHRSRVSGFFASAFEVMLRLAQGVLKLLPIGVFALMVRVVAKTGFAVFEPLLLFMLVVTAALVIHSCLTLPLLLRLVGRLSPRRWADAMSPVVMTAFSTSSSSMTLPVTLETVEKRGGVSNRVTSFTLPLGATINMDGTALYECIGVIFLAQYYSEISPDFTLTVVQQVKVVFMALLASIGAAGIPSAGLVMMLAILAALGLPLEGAALLLAVDRPLDMLRTAVNVWSDSCGAAIVARSEGEELFGAARAPT